MKMFAFTQKTVLADAFSNFPREWRMKPIISPLHDED